MIILPFLHFFAFLAYLYLLVFVLWKNPKSPLNRVCAAFLTCFALWSFTEIPFYLPYTSKDTVILCDNIGCIGWISFASFFLWFSLVFAEKKKILKTKIVYPLLFILPLLFIYKNWTGFFAAGYTREPHGWVATPSASIWYYLYYLYYLSFMIGGLYIIVNFKKKTKKPVKKKQGGIIFATVLIALILGTLFNVIFPRLNIRTIPHLANLITLIWGSGLVYAVVRYKLMVLTPAAAVNNIISTMADSLILISPNGKILTTNQYTLDLLGYKKEELVGKSIAVIFTEEETTLFEGTAMKKMIKEGSLKGHDTTYKTKSGEKIPVRLSGSAMKDKKGKLIGIVSIARDMREIKRLMQKEEELAIATTAAKTERAKAEELEKAYQELKDTQIMLIQTEKMAAVGQLASGVAHEVKNPLSIIIQGVNYLEKETEPDEEEHSEVLNMIKEAVTRADKIIHGLLNFSRLTSLELKPCKINKVIKTSLELVEKQLTLKNIKITKDFATELPLVMIDENQMEQVFINIILNSLQAMPKGGELTLRTYTKELTELKDSMGRRAKDLFEPGDGILICEVEDTGIGIPKDKLSKIFDPFFTTRPPGKGTGLGLTITRSIIEKHKGLVNIESKEGKGTKFIITLPVAEGK